MNLRKFLCSAVGVAIGLGFVLPALARNKTKTAQVPATTSASPTRDEKLWKKALEIHHKAIVVDTHNDILSLMTDENYDVGDSSVGKYHTDIARMKQGSARSGISPGCCREWRRFARLVVRAI